MRLCNLRIAIVTLSALVLLGFFYIFFNDTATNEIYTLSLPDALPIYAGQGQGAEQLLGLLAGA